MLVTGIPCSMCIYVGVLIVTSIIYLVLMKAIRSNYSFSSLLVGLLALIICISATAFDSYYLYGEQIKRNASENAAKDDSFFSKYKAAVAGFIHWYGENMDSRVFDSSSQIYFKAVIGVGSGIIGNLLAFMTVVGHISGASCVYITQTISATWYTALFTFFMLPEAFDGFKHVKNLPMNILFTTPLVLYAFLAIGSAYVNTTKKSAAMDTKKKQTLPVPVKKGGKAKKQ